MRYSGTENYVRFQLDVRLTCIYALLSSLLFRHTSVRFVSPQKDSLRCHRRRISASRRPQQWKRWADVCPLSAIRLQLHLLSADHRNAIQEEEGARGRGSSSCSVGCSGSIPWRLCTNGRSSETGNALAIRDASCDADGAPCEYQRGARMAAKKSNPAFPSALGQCRRRRRHQSQDFSDADWPRHQWTSRSSPCPSCHSTSRRST